MQKCGVRLNLFLQRIDRFVLHFHDLNIRSNTLVARLYLHIIKLVAMIYTYLSLWNNHTCKNGRTFPLNFLHFFHGVSNFNNPYLPMIMLAVPLQVTFYV